MFGGLDVKSIKSILQFLRPEELARFSYVSKEAYLFSQAMKSMTHCRLIEDIRETLQFHHFFIQERKLKGSEILNDPLSKKDLKQIQAAKAKLELWYDTCIRYFGSEYQFKKIIRLSEKNPLQLKLQDIVCDKMRGEDKRGYPYFVSTGKKKIKVYLWNGSWELILQIPKYHIREVCSEASESISQASLPSSSGSYYETPKSQL
jgi:hypothetical protein